MNMKLWSCICLKNTQVVFHHVSLKNIKKDESQDMRT